SHSRVILPLPFSLSSLTSWTHALQVVPNTGSRKETEQCGTKIAEPNFTEKEVLPQKIFRRTYLTEAKSRTAFKDLFKLIEEKTKKDPRMCDPEHTYLFYDIDGTAVHDGFAIREAGKYIFKIQQAGVHPFPLTARSFRSAGYTTNTL